MERVDTLRLVLIYIVLSAITNFPSGFTNSSVNTAVEELSSFIETSLRKRGYPHDESTVTIVQSATLNSWFIAQVFGSVFTPLVTDTYGRKIAYICCQVVTILATLVQYISVCFGLPEWLIIGRSLTALVSPLGDACLLLYLQETSPVNIRGMSSFLCEIGYGCMSVLGMVLGMRSVLGASLPKLLLVSLIPEIFSLFILFFIPETPKYLLLMKGDGVKAHQSLEFFQGVDCECELLLSEYHAEKEIERNRRNPISTFRDLFAKWHLRHAMKLACATLVLTLSSYPILQSSTYFFLKSGVPVELAETSSTAMMIVLTLSAVVGASLIDAYPRRFLIISFGILSNVLLVAFAVFSQISMRNHHQKWPVYACLASLLAYCVSYGMVLGPVSWFVAPELVSQRHKSTIFSVCFAIHNLLIALTDFATIPLFRVMGGVSFVIIFVVPSILAMIYLYLYLPETRGKETHEIVYDMLQRNSKDCLHFCDTPSFQIRPHVFTISNSLRFLARSEICDLFEFSPPMGKIEKKTG
ncbi:unnamed protein product [Caenorhabditis auriculariae]|uniref:Major facilitator superfamily (MFS) profile domain-containing protein n=1 Tax=Caenorhabditis auriculariae TaxID=2777116 RepID=A0A8S1HMN4_9PELO|nr:unnamed protein product [Caenorhabditis auriculariae]